MKKAQVLIFILVTATLANACKKYEVNPGNDPNFTIVANADKATKKLEKKVVVFGIPIYADKKVDDQKLLHAANIMAQYLDNDEDGTPDNPAVHKMLLEKKAAMVMWKRKTNLLGIKRNEGEFQDLGDAETNPNYISSGKSGRFDASLEEVFHLITHVGYANVYPNAFGEHGGSALANAMDIARGGHFEEIPKSYPAGAWYSYTDKTCGYSCMVTEYFYWAMTSILGAQESRLSEIDNEWDLNTKALVESKDPAVYALLTNPEYKLPTILPDGTYKH